MREPDDFFELPDEPYPDATFALSKAAAGELESYLEGVDRELAMVEHDIAGLLRRRDELVSLRAALTTVLQKRSMAEVTKPQGLRAAILAALTDAPTSMRPADIARAVEARGYAPPAGTKTDLPIRVGNEIYRMHK